jgi:hypothetical protein
MARTDRISCWDVAARERGADRAALAAASPAERDAIAAEAASLPLPGTGQRIVVRWDG